MKTMLMTLLLTAITMTQGYGQNLLKNGSFENGITDWKADKNVHVLSGLSSFGNPPDGKKVLQIRNFVWQNTGREVVPGENYSLNFKYSSAGSHHIIVEFGIADDTTSRGEVIEKKTFKVPSGQLWAFRPDIKTSKRFFNEAIAELEYPTSGKGTHKYLTITIKATSGFIAVDDISLIVKKPPVTVLPIKKSMADTIAKQLPDCKFLGGKNGGLVWQKNRPVALAVRDAGNVIIKKWDNGKFFEVKFDSPSKTKITNLELAAPVITPIGPGSWRMAWGNSNNPGKFRLTVNLSLKNGGQLLSLGFELKNFNKQIMSHLTLPCGWNEPKRDKAMFIIPAWIGAAVPLSGLKPIGIIYPGHLHSQWFGLQDQYFSWMIHTEDPESNLKSLSIKQDKSVIHFSWSHDFHLLPNRTYRCKYQTVINLWPKANWNVMAHTYRKWAKTMPWFMPITKKMAQRPIINHLRDGWSWLRGMPPIKEVGGRKCCTTYAQALECMDGFKKRFGISPLFWYTGWYGPFDSKYPDVFPVAPEMGGDFLTFGRKAAAGGYLVAPHINGGEWSEAAKQFDKKKMARWKGRFYYNKYNDKFGNYVVSYPCVIDEMLRYTKKIAIDSHLNAIYFDVMGHVFAHDENPNAGYNPNEFVRCNWTKAKNQAWARIRKLIPHAYIQTEGASESAIPYIDCPSGGSIGWCMTQGRRLLPLWQLVYGDTGFYLGLYDGQGQYNCHASFALNPLMAAVQQYPQGLWKKFRPRWLYLMRRQQLIGQFAGTLLLDYNEKDHFRYSRWPKACVVANNGPVRDFNLTYGGGKVFFKAMSRKSGGSVAIVNGNNVAADGVGEIQRNGKPIIKFIGTQAPFVLRDKQLVVYNPGKKAREVKIEVYNNDFAVDSLKGKNYASEAEVNIPVTRINGGGKFKLKLQPNEVIELSAN